MCIDFEVKVCTGTGIPQGSTKKSCGSEGFLLSCRLEWVRRYELGRCRINMRHTVSAAHGTFTASIHSASVSA